MPKDLNMEIDDQLYEDAKKEAQRLGIPLAGFIRLLLKQYFDGIQFAKKEVNKEENK